MLVHKRSVMTEFKTIREGLGLNRFEMAEKLGISYHTVVMYERELPAELMQKITALKPKKKAGK